ncbi:hypothetical protein KA005_83435 [bacterium]|nr:hypothetical protein [bacterium]
MPNPYTNFSVNIRDSTDERFHRASLYNSLSQSSSRACEYPKTFKHTIQQDRRRYSQAWRGRERHQDIFPTKTTELETDASDEVSSPCFCRRRQMWAALLKKVWNVDVLRCPKYGGQMKVISFIEQPFVIRRILKHLDLWEYPRPPPKPLELVCEPDVDYIPWQDDVSEIKVY